MSFVRRDYLSEKDLDRVITASGPPADAQIYIDDTPALNPLEVRAKSRRLKNEHGCGLIIIDYLKLMGSSNKSE